MSYIELLFTFFIVTTLSTIGSVSGRALLVHAKQTTELASVIQSIHSQFTQSAFTTTPQIFDNNQITSAPKVVRFNYGESVTPSALVLANQSSLTQIALSIRGRIAAHHRLPSG